MKRKQMYTEPECRFRLELALESSFMASNGATLEPIEDDDSVIEWDD